MCHELFRDLLRDGDDIPTSDQTVYDACDDQLHAALIVELTGGETDPATIAYMLDTRGGGVTYADAAQRAFGHDRVARIGYDKVDTALADMYT